MRWEWSRGMQHWTRHSYMDTLLIDAFLQLQSSVKNVFIRGSVVRYVHLPANAVDTPLLEDATRRGTDTMPGCGLVACLLTASTQRLHRQLPRPSRAPHDLSKDVYHLARWQPRDEPLHNETRMTQLATPTGCTFGTLNGGDNSVERQQWYKLSANQERVPSMIIPSSGFLDPSCLVLSP
jgi:hypothetical protein